MLDATDTLLTISEIAVAFAGFAGIASVLGRRHRSTDPRVNALRLHNLVDVALGVVFLALLPVVLDAFFVELGAKDAIAWRITAACAFLYASAMYLRVNARSVPVQQLIGYDLPGQTRIKVIAICGLACALAVVVFPVPYAYGLYLSAVGFALSASGILFLRILNSLLVIELDPPERPSD